MVAKKIIFVFFCWFISLSVAVIMRSPSVPTCPRICPLFCIQCKGATIPDPCGCCRVCAKQEGETCGIPTRTYGQCDKQLFCNIPHGSNTGKCEHCPLIKCSAEAEKCNGNFKKDKRGCNTCECACPEISNCALIKCGFGVIKTVDENGCEICHCKAQAPTVCPQVLCTKDAYDKCNGVFAKDKNGCNTCNCKCPEISNCAYIKCGFGVISFVDQNGCQKCKCKSGCSYNGKLYKLFETRYEQCNKCVCGRNGNWVCTKKLCPEGFCYFLGNQIRTGESFFDGCNQCTCVVNKNMQYGDIVCTKKACIGDCPQIYCPKVCSSGYQTDINNCPKCKCNCPAISNCLFIKCAGLTHIIDEDGCEKCTCLSCPLFPGVQGPGCGKEGLIPCLPDECNNDLDCQPGKKCCVSGGVPGSPRRCITPVLSPTGK